MSSSNQPIASERLPASDGTSGRVVSVSADAAHRFSKDVRSSITLFAGLGVAGDAHSGITVQHRSRIAVDPTQPNLRQVHIIAEELFDELAAKGFQLQPGDLGENILTRGIDLLALPVGTRLRFGQDAQVDVTGLRNPCAQIEAFRTGLLSEVVEKAADGRLIRKAGIMSVVIAGGVINVGDPIEVKLPLPPFRALERV